MVTVALFAFFLFASLLLSALLFLLQSVDPKEVTPPVEVFLHDKTETLRVETVTGKVTVVCLIIHSDSQISIREDEVSHIKISDETLGGIRIVAIAKLTIEE